MCIIDVTVWSISGADEYVGENNIFKLDNTPVEENAVPAVEDLPVSAEGKKQGENWIYTELKKFRRLI